MCVCVLAELTRSLVEVVFSSLARVVQRSFHVVTLSGSLSLSVGERERGRGEGGTGGSRCEERGMKKRGQEAWTGEETEGVTEKRQQQK